MNRMGHGSPRAGEDRLTGCLVCMRACSHAMEVSLVTDRRREECVPVSGRSRENTVGYVPYSESPSLSFSFPFPLCLPVICTTCRILVVGPREFQILNPHWCQWEPIEKMVFSVLCFASGKLHFSVLFFRVLDASCCQKEGGACCMDMLRYLDTTQVAKSLGQQLHLGCQQMCQSP